MGLIPGSGRSPGGGHGNPLQYSCLENLHGQRSLTGYSSWDHKESDTAEVAEHSTMARLYTLSNLLHLIFSGGFPEGAVGNEYTCNAGDTGDTCCIPQLERSPGGGNGNPLHYSCLENPMDRVTWWAIVQNGHKELDTTE